MGPRAEMDQAIDRAEIEGAIVGAGEHEMGVEAIGSQSSMGVEKDI